MTSLPCEPVGQASSSSATTVPLVVVSPHLDDAVLGCGDLLGQHPGSVVVTAFAGTPAAYPDLTSWDARAGFEAGDDIVASRRREDAAALTELGARPRWLDFSDPQYGERPARPTLAAALADAIEVLAPVTLAMPLGIFHDDHILTGDAMLDVLQRHPEWTWLVYADAIYRRVPDLVDNRLAALSDGGVDLRPVAGSGRPASDRKRRAIACYRSQVQALACSWDGGVSDGFEPEQHWQVVVPTGPLAAEHGIGGGSRGDRRRA